MKKLFGILLVLALVLSFSLVATTPVAAATYNVDPGDSIQDAIDAANPAGGDTIIVAAGEYQEQLLIDRGLTLRPATVNGDFVAVTIKAPDYADRIRVVKAGWPQDCYDYIIRVTANDVTIEGFTVEGYEGMYNGTQHRHCDGEWRGSAQGDVSRDPRRVGFFGIWYDGAITGGVVKNNTIKDIVAWTASAITVSDGASVAVEENVIPIHVWGNVGIMAEGTDTVVAAHKNEMSGTLGVSHWSQGGIQFGGAAGGGGATGSATQNTVEDLRSGTGAMSTGIGVYQGAEVALIQHNTLNNTDCAIILWGWSEDTKVTDIKDNALTNSRYYGIAVYEGGEVGLIEGNTVDSNHIGILTYPWGGRAAGIDQILGNTIKGNTMGIYFLADTVLPVVRYNSIADNTSWGLYNACAVAVDATLNWWGHASGPFYDLGNEGGKGDQVSEKVDFMPWLMEEDGTDLTETNTGFDVDAQAETDNVSADATGGNADTTVTVGEYVGNPTSVSAGFRAGAFYFDVHVGGPPPLPTELVVDVECPGGICSGVELKWWDGEWLPVVAPTSVVSGKIQVVLSATSSPKIEELTGTFFGLGSLSTVGWEGSSVNKAAVAAPWLALLATMMAGATLLVVRRRRAQI